MADTWPELDGTVGDRPAKHVEWVPGQGLTPAPLIPATGDPLTGFVDCEGLIAAMLAEFAAIECEKECQNRELVAGVTDKHTLNMLLALAAKHHNRLSAIQEIQLAVSVGQHRDARYGDTLIGQCVSRRSRSVGAG